MDPKCMFLYIKYVLILVYYLSKRNGIFSWLGTFCSSSDHSIPGGRLETGGRLSVLHLGFFSVPHTHPTPLMQFPQTDSLPWKWHRFLNIMILALVHLIGHLHFINFNPEHLQAIFYRIHFLDVTFIIIVN